MNKIIPQIKKSFYLSRSEDFLRRVEVISAVIIIFLMSLMIIANLMIGFNLFLFVIVIIPSFLISFFFPRSGVYAIIFLTFVWERFFTLTPILLGRQEHKIYSLDVILLAVFSGIAFQVFNSFIKNDKRFKTFIKSFLQYKKSIKYFLIFLGLVVGHFFLDITLQSEINRTVAFSSFKYYTFYPIFYLIIIILFNKKEDIKILFKFALSGGVMIIFFILYGIINSGGAWTEFTPMSTSGIRILAFTHAFYLTMLWLGLFIFVILKEKSKKMYYFLLAIFILGILGSMMRHLWLGLGFSFLIIFFIFFTKENKIFMLKQSKFYFPIILLVIIIIGYLTLIFPYSNLHNFINGIWRVIYERIISLGKMGGDTSFSWRELAWREVFKQFFYQPLYGLGLGKSVYLETAKYHDFVQIRNIHNSWLVLFAQLGVVTGSIFCLFLFRLIKNVFIIFKEKIEWMNLVVGVLILNYIFIALFQPYLETNMLGIFFWILLGLGTILGTRQYLEKSDKRLEPTKKYNKVSIPKLVIGRIKIKRK